MRSELQQWLASVDEPIRAQDWNGWLDTLERLMPTPGESKAKPAQDDFPFQVEAENWDDPTATPPGQVWRVDVSPGCCNDQPATILYRRQADPRGWTIPSADWLPPGLAVPTPPAPVLTYVDRSPLEDDPPFLLVTTPAAGATVETATDDFQTWKGSRPTYFQQDDFTDKTLWYADVTLTANPLQAFTESITGPARAELAAKLPERFRLVAGRAPVQPVGGVAGGNVAIARLFLVRDPQADDVLAADEIYIQQRVYTHLQAMIVAPGLSVTDGSIIGDLVQEELNEALEAAAGQEFWTG